MPYKSLDNPFDPESDLQHGPACNCPICVFARDQATSQYECSETEMTDRLERAVFEGNASGNDIPMLQSWLLRRRLPDQNEPCRMRIRWRVPRIIWTA